MIENQNIVSKTFCDLRPPYLPEVNGIRRNKHGRKLLMYDPEQIG